jgi:catechol 2,3-dioxygenase-like lactoylglutathione lyase family enzyme
MVDDSLPIAGIDHIGIAVPDLDAALDLFGRLGWTETMRGVAPDGITPVAFVALGTAELELFQTVGGGSAILDHIALHTDDMDAAARFLESRGVRVTGAEVEAVRGRAQRIDSAATLGLFLHLSER